MKRLLCAPLFILVLMFSAMPASADFSFGLNMGNSPALDGFTGPFVTVNVSLTDSTHAVITAASLTNGGYTYLMGDGSTFAANVDASSFDVSDITGANSYAGFTSGPYTLVNPPGSSNVDGWGKFNLTIDSHDGFKNTSDFISLLITNTSGAWATAEDVLTVNNKGQLVGSHVYAWDGCSSVAATTGYASGFDPAIPGSSVPAPSAVWLLGPALVGLAGLKRKSLG